jgi:hypothetical protein
MADPGASDYRAMKTLALLLCLALAPLAQAQDDRGMYFGAGLGSFDYDEPGNGSSLAISDSTYAYHLFGGYKFIENFALEVGIGGTGDIGESFTQTVPGLGTLALEVEGTYDIYTLTAVGILPLDRFSLFAGAGYFSASLGGTIEASGFGTVGAIDGNDSGAVATFGIQRDFGLDLKSLSIRGHYDWYDFGNGVDVSGFTVGVIFRF